MPLKSNKWEGAAALALGCALFGWFLVLMRRGLDSWFDADDLMNLHYYWSRPWSRLLKANLAFWSSYYRPAGGLFYRPIYAVWGFHPLPFRVVVLVLLSINFVLLAIVVWQLTGSRWSAILALVLIGINPSFASIYFEGGTIYDVLAFTFLWSAFGLYVRIRQRGHLPGWGSLALVFCLFAAALDAKEISVLLPVAVGLYELVWHTPRSWRIRELWRWTLQEGRFAVIGALADVVYVIGKRYGPESLWLVSAYQPHYSAAAYFQSLSNNLAQLIYKPVGLTPVRTAVLLVAMLAFAAVTRRRCLWWAVGFIAAGVLPLAFIPGRAGFAYLVPAVGWAVYAGGLWDWLIAFVTRKHVWLRIAVQVVLLVAIFMGVKHWQRVWLGMHAHAAQDGQARYRNYIEQIRALIPAPRKGARILLLSDAEGRDDYDVLFVMRLYYGDPKLVVDRMTVWRANHVQVDPNGYDYVLDWAGKRFVLVSHSSK